ncbi:TlpA family protein disulfide reductase [Wenzhouxiangella sp. AB-CW3]|uniref:TlpA family protein disulfide reductase n=1 Tax=Wenzhouxiangella sp. AB-CW3 TaxID=2771012 RepID=UPI00168B0DE1|nr:TlpA disulfide reductase family protein [Wenzhouxiangella sp. AB-CW3]QOC24050.1 TlpA family protein disulfide reductase [Wenzhouxiangella sp. AB-CW3]
MHILDQGISIGPLGFSLGTLLFLVAASLALAAGAWLGRRRELPVNNALFNLMFVSLVAARVVFVLRYWGSFGGPLDMIDIRDRGFDPLGGLVAAAMVLAWMAWRERRQLLPVLMAGSTGLLAWGSAVGIAILVTGEVERLPEINAMSLAGEPVSLAALGPEQGRPLVLNVWATWCPPCRREMPVLEEAQRAHSDIAIVLLNQGEDHASVDYFLHTQGLELDYVLLDRDNLFSPLAGVRALPTTLFYDASGRLRRQHVGELSGATLSRHIEGLERWQVPIESDSRSAGHQPRSVN